jgi:hypothetical protein
MRKLYIILFAAIAGLLASCDMSEEYTTYPFTQFSGTSATVQEDAGSITVPVVLYNASNKTVSVTVQGVDGTAVSGTNYSISDPASGVLTFSPGDSVQYVTVSIVDNPGVYTGSLDFSLSLASATENVEIYNGSTYSITITDNDHPLANLFGTYTVSGTSYYDGAETWEATFSAVEGSVDSIVVTGLGPGSPINGYSYVGEVSDDKKTITLTPLQDSEVYEYGSYLIGLLIFDGSNITDSGEIHLVQTEEGTFVCDTGLSFYAFNSDGSAAGIWDVLLPDPAITFVKQ